MYLSNFVFGFGCFYKVTALYFDTSYTGEREMTINEVAELIGVTRQTINNWIKSGKFPDCSVKVMGRRMPGTFDRNKVEAWIKENVK